MNDTRQQMKLAYLEEEATRRDIRRKEHRLREFLFELTDACNLRCQHCGSSCEADGAYIDIAQAKSVVDELEAAYDPDRMRISFTGGEPLLHPGFWEMAEYITGKGFHSGMTTNGIFIGKKEARHFADIGFETITISIDGLEESHDEFRGVPGAWKAAMRGIDNLLEAGITPSITTVANALNIGELEQIKPLFTQRGINTWRIINVDPIGRALEHPELLLDAAGSISMWTYIEDNRINHADEKPMVVASCSHYLGPVHELETRPWIFSCRSGITVASVTAKGEFLGCLDVERIPELIMGHLGQDSFVDKWENSYEPYRMSRAELSDICRDCEHKRYCDGDSQHTWDYAANRPKLCIGNRTA